MKNRILMKKNMTKRYALIITHPKNTSYSHSLSFTHSPIYLLFIAKLVKMLSKMVISIVLLAIFSRTHSDLLWNWSDHSQHVVWSIALLIWLIKISPWNAEHLFAWLPCNYTSCLSWLFTPFRSFITYSLFSIQMFKATVP